MIILSPVGLILPELLKAGGAWGEWGADEIGKIAGYVPHGLKKLSELWKAPIPDYAFSGWDKGLKSYPGYIFSGIIGAAMVIGVSILIGKIFTRKMAIPDWLKTVTRDELQVVNIKKTKREVS